MTTDQDGGGAYVDDVCPNWVMIGAPSYLPDGSDGVVLLASTALTGAQLNVEWSNSDDRYRDLSDPGPTWRPRYRTRLTADMRRYVMIVARTWPEAFEELWRTWRPEQPAGDQPALPAGDQPALPAGDAL